MRRLLFSLFSVFATTTYAGTTALGRHENGTLNSIFDALESAFTSLIITPFSTFLFFDIAFFSDEITLPFIVLWLVAGGIFLTFRMGFINFRGFKHAINVTAGKYDNDKDPGEISHFQALASALSATVGLGNIAGVAVAISAGGPGAIVWMIVAGFIGMTSKFSECTLALMYRKVDKSGNYSGGPMRYLSDGLAELGMPRLGKGMAGLFAVMCIGGSFGGGNMFQANQSFAAIKSAIPSVAEYDWIYGIILAILVGAVILGGIKRIGAAAGIIVPFMCLLYVLGSLFVLLTHFSQIPSAFGIIFSEAFSFKAGFGGFLGVLITGFRRAAFSNEAGIGSAAIAHSAASTKEPVREGIVALLGPFIDTIVICTMTGLVVVVTGAYQGNHDGGVAMTVNAYATVVPWFPKILSFAIILFAFSTMISWSYYGERCWSYLFGPNSALSYRLLFVVFVFLGSIFSLEQVLAFSDLMILGMAFPNMLGVVLLSPKIKLALNDYWGRYQSGAMRSISDEKSTFVVEQSS